jgi:capsular polysaccharide export protein
MGLRPDVLEFVSPSDELGSTVALPMQRSLGRGRHFLIVTAPFGQFGKHLGERLRRDGARCTRVLLNGGDVYDWGLTNARAYFGAQADWGDWLLETIRRENVTDIVLYGDSNPYCVEALRLAASLSLRTHVLEQGYFRPFWITLERDGVNANSRLVRDPEAYRHAAAALPAPSHVWLPPLTPAAVHRIVAYHINLWLMAPVFPRFRLAYQYSTGHQFLGHVRRYLSLKLSRTKDRRKLAEAIDTKGPLYIALLQRPGDSQLLRHSAFPRTAGYIGHVIKSFAKSAPKDARLLFKSHPLDPGVEPHESAVALAAKTSGVADRVFFTDVGDLQDLFDSSAGVVTINSTGGLASIERGRPTVVLGSAIYNMAGLTHQGGLDTFWTAPEAPDPAMFEAFRRVEMASTQVNGAYATLQGVKLAVPEVARRLLQAR